MFDLSLPLMALALYLLIWEKLPHWGSWFNGLLERSPGWLQYLYQAWRCPYCFGFWACLLLSVLTERQLFLHPAEAPAWLGYLAQPLYRFLDALAAATLVMLGNLILKALAGPAIRGHQVQQQWLDQQAQK